MPGSGGSVSDAPIEKTVDGQHHQLAYITPVEAQSLVDQGGKPTMTNEGTYGLFINLTDVNNTGSNKTSTDTNSTGSSKTSTNPNSSGSNKTSSNTAWL